MKHTLTQRPEEDLQVTKLRPGTHHSAAPDTRNGITVKTSRNVFTVLPTFLIYYNYPYLTVLETRSTVFKL